MGFDADIPNTGDACDERCLRRNGESVCQSGLPCAIHDAGGAQTVLYRCSGSGCTERIQWRGYCRECRKVWNRVNRKHLNAYKQAVREGLEPPKKMYTSWNVPEAVKFKWQQQAEVTQKLRMKMLAAYGEKCACCGDGKSNALVLRVIAVDRKPSELHLRGVPFYLQLESVKWPKNCRINSRLHVIELRCPRCRCCRRGHT